MIVSGLPRFGLAGLLTLAIQGHGSDLGSVSFGPPEDWVHAQFFNRQSSANPPDSTADDQLLLLENQFNAAQNESFIHSDRRVLTMDGVEKDSNLKIDFDPNYETLTWHWARVWRDGRHLDRLDTNSVQVVRQEKDLDEAMLNGEKSAILVLDDVRVGDVIDYAYSLKGNNPVSAGHFSAVVPVELEQPADRLLTRVLWPRAKSLYAVGHGCSVQAAAHLVQREKAGGRRRNGGRRGLVEHALGLGRPAGQKNGAHQRGNKYSGANVLSRVLHVF